MSGNLLQNLKVNHLHSPIGVGDTVCFSWETAKKQKAYQLIVSTESDTVYDSGYVISSTNFVNPNFPLQSTAEYHWTIDVQTETGEMLHSSSTFETAFINQDDFSGDFITFDTTKTKDEVSAFHFRKAFHVTHPLKKARLFIVGLGCQRTYINDADICKDDILLTPTTNSNHTVIYNTYDIASFVSNGDNQIDVIVGNGFFNDFSKNDWNFADASWRDKPMLKACIILTLENGQEEVIATDSSWLVTDHTPITFNNFRCGIYCDARIKTSPEDFRPAILATNPKGNLYPLEDHPVRIVRRFQPMSFWKVGDSYIFDAGINTSGVCELNIQGRIGQEITLSYVERLYDDKTVDLSTINCYVSSHPSQVHKYIIGSNEDEHFLPDFTYCGFRYVQVDGLEKAPTDNLITICEAYQDLPIRGKFECSNELINTIYHLAKHSASTNFHWMPTDCPHREKNGWTGDAQVSCEQFLFNFEATASYKRWLRDIAFAQAENGKLPGIIPTGGWGYHWGNGPAWDAALFVLTYNAYLYDNDTDILKKMLPTMEKYLEYLASVSNNHIVNIGLGDWCPPNSEESHLYDCPVDITDTGYYYMFINITQQIYQILGNSEMARQMETQKEEIRLAFLNTFVDLDKIEILSNSQTAYACALYHNIIPKNKAQLFADKLYKTLEENSFAHTCGMLGFKYLFTVLSKYGYLNTAYKIASQTTYPSIGYWIKNGATSLYERWQEYQSLNHHMFSSIGDWFFKYLGGIQIVSAGFEEVGIFADLPDDLDFVKVEYHSTRGIIRVEKTRDINGMVSCNVVAPPSIKWHLINNE